MIRMLQTGDVIYVLKKNITIVLWIKKKVYFCRLFEVECKGEWKSGF
jgi:hypothetical protein